MSAAEAFPMGEYLEDELEARGWSQSEFAEIIQRPTQFVSEVITGKKELTRESAAQIAAAFGTSPDYWLNLQDRYLLWLQSQDRELQRELTDVQTRARLNEIAPIALLRKRSIITDGPLDDTVAQVVHLFGLKSLHDEPDFRAAARRSNETEGPTKIQKAWLAVVRKKARQTNMHQYNAQGLQALAKKISRHVADPQGFLTLPEEFRKVGVALVYEENFPGSKLDGASFMLDDNPVIALSGRGKRLDKVLFTLLHEVAHVINQDLDGDRICIDDEVTTAPDTEGQLSDREKAADAVAADLAFPDHAFTPPPRRVARPWVEAEATRHGVHPIVVVGRLQNDKHLDWRTALAKGAPTVDHHLAAW